MQPVWVFDDQARELERKWPNLTGADSDSDVAAFRISVSIVQAPPLAAPGRAIAGYLRRSYISPITGSGQWAPVAERPVTTLPPNTRKGSHAWRNLSHLRTPVPRTSIWHSNRSPEICESAPKKSSPEPRATTTRAVTPGRYPPPGRDRLDERGQRQAAADSEAKIGRAGAEHGVCG